MKYLHDAYFANLNAVCRDGAHYTLPPGQKWTVHEYAFTQNKFYYFLHGTCRICIDGKEYIAKGGQWFYIPAGVRHSYSHLPGKSFEKYWLHFDLYPNAKLAALLGLPHMVQVGDDTRVRSLFEELTRANASDKFTDKLRAKACLLSLIALYVELCRLDTVTVGGEEEQRIQDVLSYIHNNLNRPIANAELAALCHMHPNHFIRYFAKMTGQTPGAYVTERRMETAKRLLEATDQPIARIMEQVGLQEPTHFSKLFRKYYATTPREYRKRFSK
ncbi:MAG: helix-turn-helix transcriptional regulator [Oscillospiraceae bacterium]|nr:helix-turn-helix transcriptional regulator [Oscillospiraceae bacterium]